MVESDAEPEEPAIFQATFYNYKNLLARDFAQLIFRCPLNQFDIAYGVLGAPRPSQQTWFAITRLPKEEELLEDPEVSGVNRTFRAVYHNFKNIVSQGQMELIFEIPLDQFDKAYRVLGPPRHRGETTFLIARLGVTTKEPAAPVGAPILKPKVSYWDRPRSERAALCCRDPKFQAWLVSKGRIPVATEEDATDYIHRVIGGSRSNLGKDDFVEGTQVWDKIDEAFAKHLREGKP